MMVPVMALVGGIPVIVLVLMLVVAEMTAVVMVMMAMMVVTAIFMDHDHLSLFPAGSGHRRSGRAAKAAADNGAFPAADSGTYRRSGRGTDGAADHRVTIHPIRMGRGGKSHHGHQGQHSQTLYHTFSPHGCCWVPSPTTIGIGSPSWTSEQPPAQISRWQLNAFMVPTIQKSNILQQEN